MNAAPIIAVAAGAAYLAWRQGQGAGVLDPGPVYLPEQQSSWADAWTAGFEHARDDVATEWSQGGGTVDDETNVPTEEEEQETTFMEDVGITLTGAAWGQGAAAQSVSDTNVRAFLDMIAYAEGTSGPDGYRTMFGHRLFDSFADHPRQIFSFTNKRGQTLRTSAAGRYQFLARTWDSLRAKLGLQDFGPVSQDIAAIELIRQRGALGDIKAGRIVSAITKCAPVWASLPGAGYAQPERKQSDLIAAYQSAGGAVLTA